MENHTAILTFEDVTISYCGREAVRHADFSLKEGEILGLVGESGSGKSSLIRAALGILGAGGEVTGGRIRYRKDGGEIDLSGLSESRFREIRGSRIGMIFQDAGASFCPIRTIGSQIFASVSAHQKVRKEDVKRAALELFAKLGLGDPEKIWDSCPFEMSGGMNQRVGIAASMLLKPDILLADEPTSALDPATTAQVIREMITVRDLFGTSILLVTHDISVVERMATRVVVLQNGSIVETGKTADVLRHPREPYTKRLLSAVPEFALSSEAVEKAGPSDASLSAPASSPRRASSGSKGTASASGCSSFTGKSAASAPRQAHPDKTETGEDQPDRILRAEHLCKTFRSGSKGTAAVQDVSFSIKRGEVLGLVGVSGSGKSTIARLITGLLPADSGTSSIEGQEIGGLRGKERRALRRKVQMVFQNPANSFDPRRTLGYGIRESLINQGISRRSADRAAEALLVQCGLPAGYAARYPREVSGGECQRAAIARALAADPAILICDEATSSLDVTAQQQIIALLAALKEEKHLSILFISHNKALVQMFCDRIIVLKDGRIVSEGAPEQNAAKVYTESSALRTSRGVQP